MPSVAARCKGIDGRFSSGPGGKRNQFLSESFRGIDLFSVPFREIIAAAEGRIFRRNHVGNDQSRPEGIPQGVRRVFIQFFQLDPQFPTGELDSVRRGEKKNIIPYQESADVVFNSSLVYEFSVIKNYAEHLLFGIPEDAPEYVEANRLLKFLDYFLAIDSTLVPQNSLLREFIGGSVFGV